MSALSGQPAGRHGQLTHEPAARRRLAGGPRVDRRVAGHARGEREQQRQGLSVPYGFGAGERSRTGWPGRPGGWTHLNSFDPGRSRDGRAIEPPACIPCGSPCSRLVSWRPVATAGPQPAWSRRHVWPVCGPYEPGRPSLTCWIQRVIGVASPSSQELAPRARVQPSPVSMRLKAAAHFGDQTSKHAIALPRKFCIYTPPQSMSPPRNEQATCASNPTFTRR